MNLRADIVTVYHNETNYEQHLALREALRRYEPEGYTFIAVDNRMHNRGFARGCNAGAFTRGASAPIIGFLNPDVTVSGPFLDHVEDSLVGDVVITGCRYNKPKRELELWGVTDWVCGAAFFVKRDFFTSVRGFDTQFVWGWEETDLIRQAQSYGLHCKSIELPIVHASPSHDTPRDSQYKQHYFQLGAERFYTKWPIECRARMH